MTYVYHYLIEVCQILCDCRVNLESKGHLLKSPTLTDVARQAGVSYATADRVVNNRGHVSVKSSDKVRAAVTQLRYVRNVAAANLSQGRRYRFAFLLPEGPNAFFGTIRGLLRSQITATQDVEIQDVSAFDVGRLLDHLRALSARHLDGVAVVGLDADALIEPLEVFQKRGTPVVALVSDLPTAHRAAYVGIDNVAAGRTAARLLGQAHGGKNGLVQVILGNMAARDHHDRLAGFHAVLKTDFPELGILPVLQTGDESARVQAQVQEVLRHTPDVTAIYNVGAGNSGLNRALANRTKRPLIAVHELTAQARAALENSTFDYVIDQCPEAEVETALSLMRALADGVAPPRMQPILPTIYVCDNLPL
jgi:LacI family transcriptional regulator